MALLRRSGRAAPVIEDMSPFPDDSILMDWREHPDALLGLKDALDVAGGERVVRAILAHYAVPTFHAIWPDLDWDIYRRGYAAAPGSIPPLDRRRGMSGSGYQGPLRRTDDLG